MGFYRVANPQFLTQKMKIIKIIAIVALIILVIPVIAFVLFMLFLIYLDMPCDDPVEILKIDVNNNRSVSIYEDCGWLEATTNIYYDVREAGEVIVPVTRITRYELGYVMFDFHDFNVIYAENQTLVGVYDPTEAFRELIIIDFKTGESWLMPYNEDEANVVERLQAENPNFVWPRPSYRSSPIPTPTPTLAVPTPTSTLVVNPTYYTPEP